MEHTQHRARTSLRAGVSVMLVLALAGLLFTANARLARSGEGRHTENVTELVRGEIEAATQRVEDLQTEVDARRAEVEQLVDSRSDAIDTGDPVVAARTGVAAGATAVTGPGVVVVLDDAPANSQYGADVRPDSLVVHQQDLEAVINALWAGGAEAMTLQDQRVLSTTAFRCVGNVLSLHGRVYSPPYQVQAIGDPDRLLAALEASSQIQVYQEWVEAVGLGWSATTSDRLSLPGGSTELAYARVPADVEVLP